MGREESLSRYFGGEPRVRLTISETVSGCAGSRTDGGDLRRGRGGGGVGGYGTVTVVSVLIFFFYQHKLYRHRRSAVSMGKICLVKKMQRFGGRWEWVGGHHIMAWPWGAKPLFSFNVLSAAFILPLRIRATQL